MKVLIPTLLAAAVLSACGSETVSNKASDPESPSPTSSGPLTVETVAAVADEHLDQDFTLDEASSQSDPERGVAAQLRHGADGESDGALLAVSVAKPAVAEVPTDDQCTPLETEVEEARVCLTWEEETPEEDPGFVVVTLIRSDEVVTALTAGQPITGDPREMADLEVPVADLQELVEDPRLRLQG